MLFMSLCWLLQSNFDVIVMFSERVGAEVVECACVIELPELQVCLSSWLFVSFVIIKRLEYFPVLPSASICLLKRMSIYFCAQRLLLIEVYWQLSLYTHAHPPTLTTRLMLLYVMPSRREMSRNTFWCSITLVVYMLLTSNSIEQWNSAWANW